MSGLWQICVCKFHFFFLNQWIRSSLIDINSLASSTFVNTCHIIYKQTAPENMGKAGNTNFSTNGEVFVMRIDWSGSFCQRGNKMQKTASVPLLTKLGRRSFVTSLNSDDLVVGGMTSCLWVLKPKGVKKELLFFLSSTILKLLGHQSLKLRFTF